MLFIVCFESDFVDCGCSDSCYSNKLYIYYNILLYFLYLQINLITITVSLNISFIIFINKDESIH